MEKILRCVFDGEQTHLPKKDLALLVEHLECGYTEGYGCYVTTGNLSTLTPPSNCLRFENIEPGNFISVIENEDQVIGKILPVSNLPERTLFTTGLCNSNCIMCPYTEYARLNADTVPIEILKRYIYLMDPDSDYLCITGGEPTLLKNDFISLLQAVKEHFDKAIVHILTNGRTFSYESFFLEYVKVRPYKTLLGIPLHASTHELHDYISRAKGSFAQTVAGLDILHRYGEHIEIRIVTSNINKTDLPQLATFIGNRYPNIRHVCLMGLEMMGNSMINRDEVWCPFNELMPYVNKATEILLSYGIPVQLYNYPLCYIGKKYYSLYRKSISSYKIVYLPECEICRKKEECGGFFRTTAVMPNIYVSPF